MIRPTTWSKVKMVAKTLSEVAEHIAIRAQYDNFIGGKWVPPVRGQYFDNLTPIDGKLLCRSPAPRPRTSSWRSTPRTRPRMPGATPRAAERAPHPQQDRRPDGGAISSCWRWSRRSTTASRSARPRPPTCRSPSTTSAISPAASAPRKAASPRSTTTPSPITSTSRSASSARSSRGTSRC